MEDAKKLRFLNKYKNILGDTKNTINAIQKFINENNTADCNGNGMGGNGCELHETPAESINKILNSISCEETNAEIQKIIEDL